MKPWILSFLLMFNVFALSTETKIYDIAEGDNEQALIYGFDGKVYFVPKGVQLDELTKKHGENTFAIEFDEESNEVRSFIPLEDKKPSRVQSYDLSDIYIDNRNKPEVFYLSEYDNDNALYQTFRRQNNNIIQDSQCYDRAHYWSYEWHRQKLASGKMFLFFTESYIRRYNYKWWFHVAPTFQVNPGSVRIMDPTFSNIPLSIQNWTNMFVKPQAKCPSINHYNEYFNNQNTRDCYIRHTSMYYYHPHTVRDRDLTGRPVNRWNMNEVRSAYRNVGL